MQPILVLFQANRIRSLLMTAYKSSTTISRESKQNEAGRRRLSSLNSFSRVFRMRNEARLHSCRVDAKLLLTNNDVRRSCLRNGSAVNPAQTKKDKRRFNPRPCC